MPNNALKTILAYFFYILIVKDFNIYYKIAFL